MKKIAILGTVAVLFGCSTATVADGHKASPTTTYDIVESGTPVNQIFHAVRVNTLLEQQAAEAERLGWVACIISETFGRFWAEATDDAEGLSMATFVI